MKNKNNNTTPKLVIVIFIVVFVFSMVLTEIMASQDKKLVNIDIYDYISELSGQNEKLILLTKNECSKCTEYTEVLEKIKGIEGLSVYSLNVDKLSDEEKEELTSSSDLIDLDNLPVILPVSAGAIIGNYIEDADYEDVMEFMYVFKKLTVDQYLDLVEEDTEHFIYIGRPTCSYCLQSQPWSKRIAYELGKDIYYINIDNETASDLQTLASSTEGIYSGATPLFMVIKNGEILRYLEGTGSYSELSEFFAGTNQE